MEITQEGRILSVETPKPYDYLLIKGYEAEEAISELFSIDVQLAHKEADAESRQPTIIDPKELLGGEITIAVEQRDGTKRHFHGICNRFGQGDRDADFTYYDITVVPSIWVLTQRVRSRIFQHKTVKDILAAVLEGFNFKDETQGEFKPRNYCVQYRESDFNFISRLMEEEGIFYYFVHTQNSDQMIIANTPQSHRDCPGGMEVQYEAKIEGDGEVQKGAIRSLTREFQLRPGKVTLWDYNFQLPTNQLDAVSQTQVPMDGNAAIEFYDYPGSYARKYDGIDRMGGEKPSDINNLFEEKQKIADIAMQAIDARIAEIQMTTDFGGIAAGHRFKLKNHPDAESNKQYVVTSISHSAQQSPDYISESEEGTPVNASFYCIMHGAGKPQFRPEWKTPKPTVHGAQTAVVVGPPGEEIFTDKYGRVKVKFHWDREGKAQDGDTSCWVRVAKDLSGNKWGSMHIPRVGQEVIVDFLEGDPDQPIIVGTVYNPETMPHYELPKYKTLTYLKTHSTPKQNGYSGYNELRGQVEKGADIHARPAADGPSRPRVALRDLRRQPSRGDRLQGR
jgi:type VI secretion system secreted protein VgrG